MDDRKAFALGAGPTTYTATEDGKLYCFANDLWRLQQQWSGEARGEAVELMRILETCIGLSRQSGVRPGATSAVSRPTDISGSTGHYSVCRVSS